MCRGYRILLVCGGMRTRESCMPNLHNLNFRSNFIRFQCRNLIYKQNIIDVQHCRKECRFGVTKICVGLLFGGNLIFQFKYGTLRKFYTPRKLLGQVQIYSILWRYLNLNNSLWAIRNVHLIEIAAIIFEMSNLFRLTISFIFADIL